MTKNQFLEELRNSLTGRIHEFEINSNITFYDEYISNCINEGKQEESVIEELGDPRLIARTLIDTSDIPKEYDVVDDNKDYSDKEDAKSKKFSKFAFDVIFNGRKINFFQKIIIGIILLISFLLLITCIVLFFRIIMAVIPILALILIIIVIYRLLSSR